MLNDFLRGFYYFRTSFGIWLRLIRHHKTKKDVIDIVVYFLYFYLNGLSETIYLKVK